MTSGATRQSASEALDAAAEDVGHQFIATRDTPIGGVALLRDDHGVLSVMRCLGPELTDDFAFQHDYPEESVALADLDEPGLAPLLSYVVNASGRIVAIVSGYRPGTPLSRVLDEFARGFDVQTAASIVRDVLAALGTLHDRGVPHRALDPFHVMVGADGCCFLIDAGLARRTGGPDRSGAAADDLAAVPELFLACVGARTRHGDADAGVLSGVAGAVYTALTDPPASGDSAARMKAALERVAADNFDADWDGRARERLASIAARATHSPRRSFLEVHPLQRAAEILAAYGVRERGDAVVTSARCVWSRLCGLRVSIKRGSHAAGPSNDVLRYLLPLMIIAVAFAPLLVVVLAGNSAVIPRRVTAPPSHAATPSTAAVVPVNAPTPVATTATPHLPPPNAHTSTSASATTATTTSSPPPVPPTKVTSLTIASAQYQVPYSGDLVIVVDMQTSGTAPVTVSVTVSGPFGLGGSHTDTFTESGAEQYTVTDDASVPLTDCGGYGGGRGGRSSATLEHIAVTAQPPTGAAASTSTDVISEC